MEYENEFSSLLKPLYISLKNINYTNISDPKAHVKNNIRLCVSEEKTVIKEKYKGSRRTNTNKIQKYLCSYEGCNKLFGKHSRLVVHERTHTGERPFVCDFENCSKSYTRQFHLTRHRTVSHGASQQSTTEQSYRCEKCSKEFSNPYSLIKHEKQIHRNKRYECNDCGQLFQKQQHLKSHSYVHTGIKPYKCNHPGCESRFTVPSVLKRHSLSHVKGRYNCPYDECKEKFDFYTELRAHLTTDHPKICDFCGKEFRMLSRLKTHLVSHTEVREAFFCSFTPCERYYFDERNLRNHICSKHNEHFKGFICRFCDKSLVTKQKLANHMHIHDLNKPPKPKVRKARKPRKDKGVPRTDFAKLLSGYNVEDGQNSGEICTEYCVEV